MVQLFRDGNHKDESFPVAEWVQSDYWCDQIFHNIGWLPPYKPCLDNADKDRYPSLSINFDSAQEANYWGQLTNCEITPFVALKYREFRDYVFRDEISGAYAAAQMQELCTSEYKAAGCA